MITGIKRMYKKSAIVSKPDSADTPTSNLERNEETIEVR